MCNPREFLVWNSVWHLGQANEGVDDISEAGKFSDITGKLDLALNVVQYLDW